jgi:hypothetical protein
MILFSLLIIIKFLQRGNTVAKYLTYTAKNFTFSVTTLTI